MREKLFNASGFGALASLFGVYLAVAAKSNCAAIFSLALLVASATTYCITNHACFSQTVIRIGNDAVGFPKLFLEQLYQKCGRGFVFESIEKINYNQYVSVVLKNGKRYKVTQQL